MHALMDKSEKPLKQHLTALGNHRQVSYTFVAKFTERVKELVRTREVTMPYKVSKRMKKLPSIIVH